MKHFLYTTIILIISGSQLCLANATKHKCALALLEDGKYLSLTAGVYKADPNVDIFIRPSFSKISECFTSGQYDEVIWISHGVNYGMLNPRFGPVHIIMKQGKTIKTPIYPRFFKNLVKNIENDNLALPDLTLVFCGASTKNNTSMDDLFKLYDKKSTNLSLKKESPFFSYLLKTSVTRLTRKWLNETLNKEYQSKRVNGKWCPHDKSRLECASPY